MLFDLLHLGPEILIALVACVALIIDLYDPSSNSRLSYWTVLAGLAGSFYWGLDALTIQGSVTLFNGHAVLDPFACWMRLGLIAATFLLFLYGRAYACSQGMAKSEHYVLAMLALVGMLLLVESDSLLMLYLGLELLSLPLYALISMQRSYVVSSEAAMKYFVMGGLASGFVLYGMSLLFGLTNSLFLPDIAPVLSSESLVCVFAMLFVVAGALFKMGVVPFHMWMPDVYEGSPTEITILLATLPKLAAFGMLYRLLMNVFPALASQWMVLLLALGLISIALGNFSALWQTNLKRLLAYSTISHMGFVVLGLGVAPLLSASAFEPALFYLSAYLIMTLAVFGILLMLSHLGFDLDTVDAFKGLHAQHPWFAFLMMMVMFSLAGIPPTVGFYAKFAVLHALVDAGLWMVALASLLLSVVGAYYYLKIIWMMYFEAPEHEIIPADGGVLVHTALSFNALLVLILGLVPSLLLQGVVLALG